MNNLYGSIKIKDQTNGKLSGSINGKQQLTGSLIEKGSPGPMGPQGPKGDPGEPGISGVYVGSGIAPDGYNVHIDPNGESSELVTAEEFNQFKKTIPTKLSDLEIDVEVGNVTPDDALALLVEMCFVEPVTNNGCIFTDANGIIYTF